MNTEDRDTKARGHRYRRVRGPDHAADALGRGPGRRFVGAVQDHRELLAAVAGQQVAVPAGVRDRPRGRAQHVVAGLVAAPVVDRLEVVEVDDGERERQAGGDRLGDPLVEPAPVATPVKPSAWACALIRSTRTVRPSASAACPTACSAVLTMRRSTRCDRRCEEPLGCSTTSAPVTWSRTNGTTTRLRAPGRIALSQPSAAGSSRATSAVDRAARARARTPSGVTIR